MTHFRSSESYQSAVTLGKTVARDCDTAKKYIVTGYYELSLPLKLLL